MTDPSAHKWDTGRQEDVNTLWRHAVQTWPDRPYLECGDRTVTYREAHDEILSIAAGLREHGVEPGHRVVTLFNNSVEGALVWFAINALGAVWAPINVANKGEFLRHQIVETGAHVVVGETMFVERVADLLPQLPLVKLLVSRESLVAAEGALSIDLAELRRAEHDVEFCDVQPGDLSLLVFTAGTTGPSKACMIGYNYTCNLARQYLEGTGRTADEIAWTALPLFHFNAAATGLVSTLMIGSKLFLAEKFSVSRFWDQIEQSGARVATLLGAMLTLVVNAPETEAEKRTFGQLRAVRGAPFPSEVQARWRERFGSEVLGSHSYGLTEITCVTSLSAADSHAAPPGSSGRRNDDFDVRIVDENDFEVPTGETGEVIVRPRRPNIMFQGYFNRPDATADVVRNLWFHTGDLGMFDEDGYFYFKDRKKDYLRRRGENISSYEVETTFFTHPDVREVAVHAVPSGFTEDEVKATVVLRPGAVITEKELCEWSVDRLPYFAVPRFLEFRDVLPKNPVGRVVKYQLREDGVTPTTFDRETSDVEIRR